MIATSLVLAALLGAQPPAPLVQVSDPTIAIDSSGTPQVAVYVQNRTDQPVTAWGVAYKIHFADGTAEDGTFDSDGLLELGRFVSPPQTSLTRALVRPQSTIHAGGSVGVASRDRQSVAITAITDLTLMYAIFADDSSIGHPASVKAAFDLKQTERQILQSLIDGTLRQQPQATLLRASMEAEQRHWAYAAHRFPKSAPVTSVEALNSAIVLDADGYQTIELDLKNLGDQTVVAWNVSLVVHLSDGTAERRGFGRDGLTAFAGLLSGANGRMGETLVPPHSIVRTREGYISAMKGVTAVSVSLVTVTDVVFDDDSWAGDQGYVESQFETRARIADAMTKVLPILRTALDAGGSAAALRAALDNLAPRPPQDFEAAQRQVARTNIQLLLDGRIKLSPTAALEQWIETLEAERALYQAHSRPKQNSPDGL